MGVKSTQLTVGRLLHATFWFAVSAALVSIVEHRQWLPAPRLDLLALLDVGALLASTIGIGILCGRRVLGTGCVKNLCITIACWHLLCFGMALIFETTFGQLILAGYTARFGDVHASFGTFERVLKYCWIATVTTPATILSIWFFNAMSRGHCGWKRAARIFLGWQVGNVVVLVWCYETGVYYHLNQVGWSILGAPENIYSFTNGMLHRIIGWVLCTTPIAWIALCMLPRARDENHSPGARGEDLKGDSSRSAATPDLRA